MVASFTKLRGRRPRKEIEIKVAADGRLVSSKTRWRLIVLVTQHQKTPDEDDEVNKVATQNSAP